VRPAEGGVRIGQDRHATVQQVRGGVAVALPPQPVEPTSPGQVLGVPRNVPVHQPVVLHQAPGTGDPQITAQGAAAIDDDVLRVDRDPAEDVQQAQHRLPR